MSERVLEDFRVGDVFSQSFKTLFRNIVPFMSIAVVIYLPLFLLMYFLVAQTPATDASGAVTDFSNSLYSAFLGVALFIVFTYLVYGTITYGTIRDLQGRPARFGEIMSRGFATFLPVLGVAIVSWICVVAGFLFLIIPGIFVSVVIYVAVPAAVVERKSVFESLSRSAELTKGYRWQILGISILVTVINFAVGKIEDLFIFAGTIVYSILNILSTGIILAFGAVVAAVVYQQLRRVKEGVDIDTIASVFS